MKPKLNDSQRLFCAEYVKDFNATKAAVRAGYSKSTARQQGARLLSNVAIQECLSTTIENRISKVGYDATRLLADLVDVLLASKARAVSDEGEAKDVTAFKAVADSVGRHIDVRAYQDVQEHRVVGKLDDVLNFRLEKAKERSLEARKIS